MGEQQPAERRAEDDRADDPRDPAALRPASAERHSEGAHAPIVHELDVHVSRARAFDAFVHGLGEWWHPGRTVSGTGLDRIDVQAHPGGRIVERARDGAEHEWGEVLLVEQGERFAHTLRLGHDGDPTEVVVSFSDLAQGGTRVRLEHGGWNASNAHARAVHGDWTRLLERYVAHATHA